MFLTIPKMVMLLWQLQIKGYLCASRTGLSGSCCLGWQRALALAGQLNLPFMSLS